MCGIAGIVGENNEPTLRAISQALQHRGPDDEGIWLGEKAGLAHRRLSIIDLSTGHQPMCNEDETIWLVFNGEIYNYQSLRKDLKKRGHQFQTRSDTEVIVHAYEEFGPDCLSHFRGCFAFAIWDIQKKILFAARDRFGQKPFYFSDNGKRMVFASDFYSLTTDQTISSDLDMSAIGEFFRFGYIPAPRTAWKAVRKLPAAHYLIWDDGELSTERYWEPQFEPKLDISEHEAMEELGRLLKESVQLRMISDVPLGACLSGGIDSSVIVALMARATDGPLRTFTVGFHDEQFDERPYAREVASMYATDHHESVVDGEIVEALPALVRLYGEPYADSSAVPTYQLSRQVSEHVKVALVGDGGDELFAGYLRYARTIGARTPTESWRGKVRRRLERLPSWLTEPVGHAGATIAGAMEDETQPSNVRQGFQHLLMDLGERYWSERDLFARKNYSAAFSEEFRPLFNGLSPTQQRVAAILDDDAHEQLDRLLRLEMEVPLPDDLCTKMDVASMANGLEARAPFLDHKLAEFVNRLPSDFKLRGGVTKYLLKKRFAADLPEGLVLRTKQGFSPPQGDWLAGELVPMLKDILLSPQTRSPGIYDVSSVEKLITQHVTGERDHRRILWRMLMFGLWFEEVQSSRLT